MSRVEHVPDFGGVVRVGPRQPDLSYDFLSGAELDQKYQLIAGPLQVRSGIDPELVVSFLLAPCSCAQVTGDICSGPVCMDGIDISGAGLAK